MNAANITAASVFAVIDNRNGGTIGSDAAINFTLGGVLTTAAGNANFSILGGSESYGAASINVSAGSMNIGGALAASINAGDGQAFDLQNVFIHVNGDIMVGDRIIVGGSVTAGGNISAANGIFLNGGSLTAGDLIAGGSIVASGILADEISAGTDITINAVEGGFLKASSVTAGGALNLINTSTISYAFAPSDGIIGFTPVDFSLSVGSIGRMGSTVPLLSFDGLDAVPNQANDNPGNGGNVTLSINAGGLSIGSQGDLGGINASGGLFGTDSTAGGNGGNVVINATGDLTLADGDILATSGVIPVGGPNTLGNGGSVTVETPGAITVNSKIEVSSAGPTPGPARRSAKGGNIRLASGKTGAVGGPRPVAIDVGNSGQLLALLDATAPGPGGKIVISATGANSDVKVRGRVQADRGLVDIRHTGSGGNVTLDGAVGTGAHGPSGSLGTLDVHGDVVKVAALGDNGVLKIGNGIISADSTLQLYATGFNGEVRFVGNAILSGNSVKSIAGNAVTINNGVFVLVGGPAASVYVNSTGGIPNANYTGFGGNGTTTGTFTGSGANSPQPLSQAPPLGPPPSRPGR